jgi:hypothetical protein
MSIEEEAKPAGDGPGLGITMRVCPGYRHLAFAGVLSNAGLVTELRRVWDSADYAYDRHELYDLRGLTGSEIDGDGIRSAAELDLELFGDAPDLRSAIVADTHLAFGIARMFQAHLGHREDNVRVFEDFDAAVAWLAG